MCIYSYFFNPACFKALFNVPGGISTLDFPATVTVPFLVLRPNVEVRGAPRARRGIADRRPLAARPAPPPC